MARYGCMQYAVYLRRSEHRIYFASANFNVTMTVEAWIQRSTHYTIDQRFLIVDLDQVPDPKVRKQLLKTQEVVQNEFQT